MKYALIYRDLNINKGDFIHTRYLEPYGLENAFSLNKIAEIELDNYRENSHVFKFDLSNFPLRSVGAHTLESYERVTYIIVREKNSANQYTYWRCFFVDFCQIQSGFAIFNCSVDYWGTYYHLAKFKNIRVSRCNRDFANGIYDPITAALPTPHYVYKAQSFARPINEFCVVFSMSVTLQTSWFGNDPLTQTFLFYLPLEDIGAKTISTYDALDIVEKVRFIIGSIKETLGNIGTMKAQVLRCWILPKTAVATGQVGISSIVFNTFIAGGTDQNFSNVLIAKLGRKEEAFNIQTILGSDFDTYFPSSILEFGAIGRSMRLERFTDDKKVYVRYSTESAAVRVEIIQGNNILDITPAFELDININNQVGTFTQQFAENTGKIVALVGGTAAALASNAGYLGAAAVGIGGFLGLQGGRAGASPSSQNGDAATTYSLGDAAYVAFPLYLTCYKSNRDEKAHARVYGVNYDDYITDFASLYNYSLLGDKTGFTYTYLAASVVVEGLPTDAANYFVDELKRGVYFE